MEMTRQEFDKLAKQNNWEVYTQRQVYQFSQDILKSVDPIEREHGAIDYVSLNRVTVVNDDLTKSVVYWREQQVEWDKAEDGTLMKARSGVYKDTPANRKKGIVGQRYGGKKEEMLEEKKKKYGSESTKEAIGRAKKDAKLSDGELEAKVAKFREKGPRTEEEWSLAREYRDRKASKDNKKKKKDLHAHVERFAEEGKDRTSMARSGKFPGLADAKKAAFDAGYSQGEVGSVIRSHIAMMDSEDRELSMFDGEKVDKNEIINQIKAKKGNKEEAERKKQARAKEKESSKEKQPAASIDSSTISSAVTSVYDSSSDLYPKIANAVNNDEPTDKIRKEFVDSVVSSLSKKYGKDAAEGARKAIDEKAKTLFENAYDPEEDYDD